MGNIQHSSLAYSEVHVPFSYSYANSTAREGDSGFVSGDIGKLALQTDNNTLWMLTATTPTWVAAILVGSITVDTILEDTPGAGVTIDGVLNKDFTVTASGGFIGDLTGAVTGAITGDLTGDVLADNATKVLENGPDGTGASLIGSLKADDGTVVFDPGADGSTVLMNGTGVSGTLIKDEDTMVSDSATHLASQQSIKAYAESVHGTESFSIIPVSISAITKANPAVITTTSAHGYSTGNDVDIHSVGGMVELTDGSYTVTVLDSTSFSLDGIDSTAYTVYTSGGVTASSCIFNVPSNVSVIFVTAIAGGGGGGGGCNGDSASASRGGGGGGSCGETLADYPLAVTPSGTVPVTIGAGGAGGAVGSSGNDGVDGTDTKIGIITVAGGNKGHSGVSDRAGGAAKISYIPAFSYAGGAGGVNVQGVDGGDCHAYAGGAGGTVLIAQYGGGGGGGSSIFSDGADGGDGGSTSQPVTTGDDAGDNTGCGGGGGGEGFGANLAGPGGAGGSGYILISW